MNLSVKKTWLCYDASTMIAYVKFTTFSRNAKTGLSHYGFNPVFVLKTKATRWCALEQTKCKSD